MRLLGTIVGITAAACFATTGPAYAQRGHAPAPQSHGHATTPPTPTTSGPSGTTSTTPSTASTASPPSTSTPPTSTPATVNQVAQRIASHPQLASKVAALLPKGMTLSQASTGFRNQGQFIAALHVSQNLNIPFAELKDTMLGKTSGTTSGTSSTRSSPMSLGQAVHQLRPSADSTTEVAHARAQAHSDLLTGGTTSTTTSASASTSTPTTPTGTTTRKQSSR